MGRQHLAVDHRAEIVAVEQRHSAAAAASSAPARSPPAAWSTGSACSLSSVVRRRARAASAPRRRAASCAPVRRSARLAPLWMIAWWNSPLAAGIASSALTFPPPPDWPKIVTLPGSPPNARDVVAHPFQRRDEIEHADVARLSAKRSPPMAAEIEVAEDVEPVVDRDHHDVAALREIGAVVPGELRRADRRSRRHAARP